MISNAHCGQAEQRSHDCVQTTRGGTRTHNLLLRREAPYPLGHTSLYEGGNSDPSTPAGHLQVLRRPTFVQDISLRVLRSMAALDADHYPERLGRLIVVNAPRLLAFAWRASRPAARRASRRAVPPHLTRHLHQARDPLVARRPSACEGGHHL